MLVLNHESSYLQPFVHVHTKGVVTEVDIFEIKPEIRMLLDFFLSL